MRSSPNFLWFMNLSFYFRYPDFFQKLNHREIETSKDREIENSKYRKIQKLKNFQNWNVEQLRNRQIGELE